MTERKVDWNELSLFEKELALNNYIAIRSEEEQCDYPYERAQDEVPFCKGYYITKDGAVSVDV